LIVGGLMSLPSLPSMGPKGLMLAASNWIAIAGTFSYAYGFRPRPLWGWRAFALGFSFYTVGTLGVLAGRVAGYVRYDPRPTPPSVWIIVAATLSVCACTCIALLRHAELLRGGHRSAMRKLEGVFA